MKITFHGGAQSVTGANYLLETENTKVLIDCGLAQGSNFAERSNFEDFPYDLKSIDAVFITHAHIDHTGRLPRLYKLGFRGTVYSTAPTKDFSEVLLLDSEHLLNDEARREGKPELYNTEDVLGIMRHWEAVDYHTELTIGDIKATFFEAGHILGSATILFEGDGKKIVFSGDLGNSPAPIIHESDPLPEADYCVIESTYGDRVHDDPKNRLDELENVIEGIAKEKGTLLIPAFAMERTQELLYHIDQLFREGRVPKMPVFVDSPLAIKITMVYKKYHKLFDEEAKDVAADGDDLLNFPELKFTLSTEQSKEINGENPPKIIIAGSGMSQGGRILHHERRYLSDYKNAILFVGYQSKGSLGRRIMEGEKVVRIFDEEISVNAKVLSLTSYSAHADQPRLLAWLYPRRDVLKRVFVVQGEDEASNVLALKIKDELALHAEVPKQGDSFVL